MSQIHQIQSLIRRRFGALARISFVALLLGLVMLFASGERRGFEAPNLIEPAFALAPRTESEQQVIDAYKRTNKCVVYVSTKATARDFWGPTAQEGSGSGVIVDAKSGRLITNFHVIDGADQVVVTLASGQSYPVKLIGQDPDNDLAVMQIVNPPEDLVEVEFGDSATLEVGQRVLAIGNPFGLNRTLTDGIISSLGRTIRAESGRMIQDVIQTDAAINPGNSGGPLLDTSGKLVGLNTAIVSRTGENAGIGFAIPVNLIRQTLPELIRFGKVLRPKIGVILEDTDLGIPVVDYVQPGSPADEGGLVGARRQVQFGGFSGVVRDLSQADFIVGVNGEPVRSKLEVFDQISKTGSDKSIELLVRRGLGRSTARKVRIKPILG